MSQSEAVSEAKRLKKIVESYGVRCTIELQAGRPWSGSRWYSRKYVLMNHHTAGPMSGNTPSLSVCKNGRTGIPGPLCNGYMGRDLVFRIITLGLANHPGAGGPLTRDGVTLPRDSARIGSFGIEFEHDGRSAWPKGMRDAMAKVGAAVLDWLNRPTTSSIEHATWTTRKIDRSPSYARSGSTGQKEINAVRGNPEDDVSAKDVLDALKSSEGRELLADAVWGVKDARKLKHVLNDTTHAPASFLRGIRKDVHDTNQIVENIGYEVLSYQHPRYPVGDAFAIIRSAQRDAAVARALAEASAVKQLTEADVKTLVADVEARFAKVEPTDSKG